MRTTLVNTLPGLALLITGVAVAAESPLGSPASIVGRYSANYPEIVRAALPKVDMATLNRLLADVKAAAAAEKPLAITNLRQLERTFGLRERGKADASGFLDVGEAVYRVDGDGQRIYLARRYPELQPVSRQDFAGELPAIRAAHQDLVERLGIPRQEVFFIDVREILSETDGHPEREAGVKGEIQSEGAVTTMLRAVGGVLVEGSYVRLSSIDGKRLDLVDVRWPAVRLTAAALKNGLRAPQESIESITRRVAADSKGQAVNVRMAVVLRPVQSGLPNRPTGFVPSLKVVIEPQSIKTEGGYRTDAGEIFFVDLVRGAPPFADVSAPDKAQSPEVR